MRSVNQWWPRAQNDIAVVVTIHDNPRLLHDILESLAAQAGMAGRRWQVVVVDNGSREGVPAALRARSFPFRLTVLEQRHTGEAWARNEGWKAAVASTVLFLDDDQVPGGRLLAEHLRAHATHPGAVVLGRITLARNHRPHAWTEYDAARMDAKYAALAGRERPSGLHAGGNFSISTEALERAGGFDHHLPGSEHVDLGFRLHEIGLRFVYWPPAHVVGHSSPDLGRWRLRHGLQGRLDVAMFRDRGYGGGLVNMVAAFHDRHPLNRAAVRLALSADPAERAIVGAAGAIGELAMRLRLRGVALASMSVVANVLYWAGVRDGLRGNGRFWQLVRVTRKHSSRTYEKASGAAT